MAGSSKKHDLRGSNPLSRHLSNEHTGSSSRATSTASDTSIPEDVPATTPEGHKTCIISIVNAPRGNEIEPKQEVQEKDIRPWLESGTESDSDSDLEKEAANAIQKLDVKSPARVQPRTRASRLPCLTAAARRRIHDQARQAMEEENIVYEALSDEDPVIVPGAMNFVRSFK